MMNLWMNLWETDNEKLDRKNDDLFLHFYVSVIFFWLSIHHLEKLWQIQSKTKLCRVGMKIQVEIQNASKVFKIQQT